MSLFFRLTNQTVNCTALDVLKDFESHNVGVLRVGCSKDKKCLFSTPSSEKVLQAQFFPLTSLLLRINVLSQIPLQQLNRFQKNSQLSKLNSKPQIPFCSERFAQLLLVHPLNHHLFQMGQRD